jgi:hypothetical protein
MMDKFTFGDRGPVVQRMCLSYKVSGQPLAEKEIIQIVARLPFCLYVPSTRYLLRLPSSDELIGVAPEKAWTDRADGSDILDFEVVVPAQNVYLNNSEVTTEHIGTPSNFTAGPKGKNVEFDRDPSGYFRYTRITLEMDWEFPSGFDLFMEDNEGKFSISDAISTRTLGIVNHIIDLYRVVTGDSYIKRLSRIVVEDIRIGIPDECSFRKNEKLSGKFSYKGGLHPYELSSHGVRPAIVSKSSEIVEAFKSSLANGESAETHRLLQLNAEEALEQWDSKLAVIESFLALEIYVEQFFRQRLAFSMTANDIEDLLTREDHWRLKVRLKKLLKEKFSRSISDIDNAFWQNWCDAHEMRNALVHRGLLPTLEESRRILDLNRRVIQVLESL